MSTTIRGIDFGAAWCASGARGWFGEGYWFHRFVPGLNWEGSTFVAKTTTLEAREGNTPLKSDWTPKGLLPKSIVVYPFAGAALNAVGLSGPGAQALLETGRWQARTEPFFLSFMAVGATKAERFEEAKKFSRLLMRHREEFRAPFGLQVNLSCPNASLDLDELVSESAEFLDYVTERLEGVPIVAKVNALFPTEAAARLDAFCDGICVSNTIPWGKLPDQIDWTGLSPSGVSPLQDLGGGGLSGAPIRHVVVSWIADLKRSGFTRHVNACGGIMSPQDVRLMAVGGKADSVSLGTIAMLRGWRLRKTIRKAKELLS